MVSPQASSRTEPLGPACRDDRNAAPRTWLWIAPFRAARVFSAAVIGAMACATHASGIDDALARSSRQLCVCGRVVVALWTTRVVFRVSGFCVNVLLWRDRNKVLRQHAFSIATDMVQLIADRDRANEVLVEQPVRLVNPAAKRDVSVPMALRAMAERAEPHATLAALFSACLPQFRDGIWPTHNHQLYRWFPADVRVG
jgi:hypothetical protein